MDGWNVVRAFDQRALETLTTHSAEQALARLGEAHARYADRDGWLPLATRIAILERTAAGIAAQAEALAVQVAEEGGKPLRDARVEVQRAKAGVESAVSVLKTAGGRQVPMGLSERTAGRVAYTWHEPRGVALALSAFNHPLNLIVHQVIPAVATGCPVLVKPARRTPLSCRALLKLLAEAGLPPGFAQMLRCDHAVSEALIADPRVAFFSFIGSARVGWRLRSKLAPGATCTLEHGGVAPVIVDASADLDEAVPRLLKGAFYHAGQVCVSVQRIYVHTRIADAFLERFVAGAKALKVGCPTDPDTEVGPLIAPREVERVHRWVTEAQASGARLRGAHLHCGGRPIGSSCYAPTVLEEPADDAQVSRAEVFGPVACVYRYDDLDAAIARANLPGAYFQAAIFTESLNVALRAHRRLHGTAVIVNDHPAFRADWMPFGGHRDSGLGSGGIGPTMEAMQLERLLVLRSGELP